MDSLAECPPAETTAKSQHSQELKEEIVKVNGEINGSYTEEMEVCEEEEDEDEEEEEEINSHENNEAVSLVSGVTAKQSNGEVKETTGGRVPSQHNGNIDNRDCLPAELDAKDVIAEPVSDECSVSASASASEASAAVDTSGSRDEDLDKERTQTVNQVSHCNSSSSELQEEPTSSGNALSEPPSDKEDVPSAEEAATAGGGGDMPLDDSHEDDKMEVEEEEEEEEVEEEPPCDAPLNMTVAKKHHDEADSSTAKTPEKMQEDPDSALEKTSSSKKKKVQSITVVTPRRSSRNLNKTKSYADKDIYIEELDRKSTLDDDDDDVEEIIPTDPLADDGSPKKSRGKTTIVVNDTKRLVEIAAGSKQSSRGGKKEPTLVIIDTNSILSGKGAVAVSQTSLPQMTITPAPPRNSFSMLPVNMGTGYPPKHIKISAAPPPPPPQPKPVILPSLTDDMYVVEAPSFIVPYVYEKPPVTSLKEYVDEMEKVVKELRAQEEKEAKLRKKKDEETAVAPAEDKSEVEGSDREEKKDGAKSDTETDDEIKESGDEETKKKEGSGEEGEKIKKRGDTYFDNPLGKFFMQIGVNLVQEFVQTDLLRNQKRKRDRDGKNCPAEVHVAISSLLRTLECSKENNQPYRMELKKCELCSFRTESELVMAHHLETPHMRNYVYRCNFCTMEVRSPHDILFHMEAVHNVRGRLERAPAFHQCPNCPFEDNQKGKLSRHLLSCAKKYKPERNQEPPLDWEPPAKIPRVRGGGRPGAGGGAAGLGSGSHMYPMGSGAGQGGRLGALGGGRLPPAPPIAPHLHHPPPPAQHHSLLAAAAAHRGRGRPPISGINRYVSDVRANHQQKLISQMRPGGSMVFRSSGTNCQPQVLLPTSYQISNSQLFQNKNTSNSSSAATAKLLQQPSISITPLPRTQGGSASSGGSSSPSLSIGSASTSPGGQHLTKPGRPPGPAGSSSKATFVICEICDGYIKDLEQLRNHMQWIHKVKIHPKMIHNRPPLNCQKCQFRFFTDQGLERHLLGSHGLVTSSMQEAANKGKDGGRCPVCGRVYQWKLLNHVARDHNMSLKPAHLSYKCTVCTATFGMYKQFENHVYSAHSVVAKRVMDKKPMPGGASITSASVSSSSAAAPSAPSPQPSTSSNSQSESLLKPLKINDEITIIPQPARAKTKPTPQPQKTNKV